ncbi:ABC transporter permease [Pontimonas sp.]|jgi:putative ABC transport system permease protein|uniref:ABC transporter permease n=1 Tax=Pontimonas sp. TaxID=2304492 RepID=UPI0028708057|nr:ABC transporter permease [Pontimonas sp.]MDR9396013.1 ABC transporter permease [Pontimonas sp.]MDR9434427.1 ABC transporter permease [Pontimonas sp.]
MTFALLLRLATQRIWASKLRSALTMLGIVIGVSAVVTLISVGQGAQQGINDSLADLGANQISVTSTTPDGLQDQDMDNIATIQGVSRVSSEVRSNGDASFEGNDARVSLIGVSPGYEAIATPTVGSGRFLPENQAAQSSRVAVLSAIAASDLGVGFDDLGSEIRVNGVAFQVIGVLDDAEGFGGGGNVLMTQTAARSLYAKSPYVSVINIQAVDKEAVAAVESSVESYLRVSKGFVDDDDAEFIIFNQAALQDAVNTVTGTLSLFITAIAGISLVVGGIGIMNIMLVSVRERTREIGVRRAIGATQGQILTQFLLEAVLLSVLGGLIGLIIGLVSSFGLAQLGGWDFFIDPGTVALALGFSAFVGIVFGVWPARTAGKLQPVEALRFE